jgi:iron complex transport system substrate-binding protein
LRSPDLFRLALTLVLAVSCSARGEGLTLRDDAGRSVEIRVPVGRIVTLAPHLAELVFAAGAGSKLVGVSAHSDYPPAVEKLPVVAGAGRADVERILALRPDVVLAWASGGQSADAERLAALGIPVLLLEPRRLEDIARQLELIGRLAGTGYEATRAAHGVRSRLRELATRFSGRRPVGVFYAIWRNPLMTVNGRHIISEAITLCGGRNVFADLPVLVPTVSMEGLLAIDPEAIVASGEVSRRAQLLVEWQEERRLRAVRAGNVYFSDADLMHRATPRMLEGIRALCEDLERARSKSDAASLKRAP